MRNDQSMKRARSRIESSSNHIINDIRDTGNVSVASAFHQLLHENQPEHLFSAGRHQGAAAVVIPSRLRLTRRLLLLLPRSPLRRRYSYDDSAGGAGRKCSLPERYRRSEFELERKRKAASRLAVAELGLS
nr:hypothetical protein Itr_chr01CG18880 [Ipomoea trifida]